MTPEEILDEIAQQTRVCTRCPLHLSRKNAVPGEGNPHSRIMFIGEGPGFYENEQGRPFVGAAGNFLDELLGDAASAKKCYYHRPNAPAWHRLEPKNDACKLP